MASCSHWWRLPVYITISVVLAFLAISTALRSSTNDNTNIPLESKSTAYNHRRQLSLNISRTLRTSGFNIIATLLQISPETFFSSPNITIFAIKDSALITNTTPTSLPPWLLERLLQYHTSPLRFSVTDLLGQPQGSCFPTLLRRKNLVVTKVDAKNRFVEINHVLISHPDMFLDATITIHGVVRPFSSLNSQDLYNNWDDPIKAPTCHANYSLVSDSVRTRKMVLEWTKIVHSLSSNGFASFAIGLNSVLNGILEEGYKNLDSVTIFTPPNFAFVAFPSPILDKIVRSHIVPKMVTYGQLSLLPNKTLLKSLVPNHDLEVTTGGNGKYKSVAINGVEIMTPEVISSEKFIVHGISRALEMHELPNFSR